MLDRLLNWLASLRLRLIVTYVMVTVMSFGLLLLLLMDPVEEFLIKREKNNLSNLAITLGTTIRTPYEASETDWVLDQKWNHRRCRRYLAPRIGARIRMLDQRGRVLTDSQCAMDWDDWMAVRATMPSLRTRPEVLDAMHGQQGTERRPEEGQRTGKDTIYVAMPTFRLDPRTERERVAFIFYISKPVDSVGMDLRALRSLTMIGMVASLLITVLVSILLSSSLSGGLSSATRVARAFAAGQMDLRMREKGRDEVGQLGAAFNQMADALQRHEQLRRNLLADVSHELRTPLTAIAGCADTLVEGAMREDPETAERFLGTILRESERLKRLVTDILELSRLQAGAVDIPLKPVPVCPIIDDAIEIARLHARQDGVTIRRCLPDFCKEDGLVVLGNEDRLAQALRNLLDNARHHTPPGKAITVAVEIDEPEVVIHVRDEGEGIPADDLPWVFDRFYRAGKGAKPGGTGLGLAIVREILQAHQGHVTVESTMGEGTTFSLHLIRVQAGVNDDTVTLHERG